MLIKNNEKDLYTVDIKHVTDEKEEPKGEVCHMILAETYSRKSLEPVLKSFFSNLKSDSKIICDENK